MRRELAIGLLVPALAAGLARGAVTTAFPAITVNCATRYQVIDGFGGAVSHHQTLIQQLYNFDQAFQDMLLNDLGLTVARFALPPTIQAVEDLDTNTLDLATFNMAAVESGPALTSMYTKSGGAAKIVFSIWSPPAWMKTNNQTTNGGNLRVDRRVHFAKYCAGAVLGMSNYWGIPLYAMSPQNEPYFTEPYDSCVYSYSQYAPMFKELVAAYQRWGVSVKVFGPEDMGHAENRNYAYLMPILTNAALSPYLHMCATHGYGNDGMSPGGATPAEAEYYRTWLAPYGKGHWMSETSGEYPAWTNGYYATPGILLKGALSLAWKIHVGLAHGNQNAFVYWVISDASGGQFSLLIYKTPTPKYYAAKHFYRWIRPNARRVFAMPTTNDFGVGAYLHETNQTLTLTFVNMTTTNQCVTVALTNVPWQIAAFETYRSSVSERCARLANTWVTTNVVALVVPAESVMTLFSGVATNAVAVATPVMLDYETNGAARGIEVRNDGLGTFAYSAAVVSGLQWLAVLPTNGVISNQVVTLTATANACALPKGAHEGIIRITASTGTNITIVARVFAMPTNAVPTAWPVALDFTNAHTTLSINLGNEGLAPYTFAATVTNGGAWLNVAPARGTVLAPVSIYATADRDMLPVGVSTATVALVTSVQTNWMLPVFIWSDVPEPAAVFCIMLGAVCSRARRARVFLNGVCCGRFVIPHRRCAPGATEVHAGCRARKRH